MDGVHFDDPLHAALFRTVLAAKQAKGCLYWATCSGDTPAELRKRADSLERQLAKESSLFDPGFEHLVQGVADELGALAQSESLMVYIYDEHCLSCDQSYLRYTDRGELMMTACSALLALVNALDDLQSHLAAERMLWRCRSDT